jgi:hypothetical protein
MVRFPSATNLRRRLAVRSLSFESSGLRFSFAHLASRQRSFYHHACKASPFDMMVDGCWRSLPPVERVKLITYLADVKLIHWLKFHSHQRSSSYGDELWWSFHSLHSLHREIFTRRRVLNSQERKMAW